jgi:hypothetical protein
LRHPVGIFTTVLQRLETQRLSIPVAILPPEMARKTSQKSVALEVHDPLKQRGRLKAVGGSSKAACG